MITDAMSVAERVDTLGICPIFAGVPSSELGVLAEMLETERLDTHEILCAAGEPSDRIYLVADGALSIFVGGRGEPVRTLGRGDLLGEYGMFGDLVRTATVRADGPAVVLSLDYERFRAFLLEFPSATLELLRTATHRLLAAERRAAGHADSPGPSP